MRVPAGPSAARPGPPQEPADGAGVGCGVPLLSFFLLPPRWLWPALSGQSQKATPSQIPDIRPRLLNIRGLDPPWGSPCTEFPFTGRETEDQEGLVTCNQQRQE